MKTHCLRTSSNYVKKELCESPELNISRVTLGVGPATDLRDDLHYPV